MNATTGTPRQHFVTAALEYVKVIVDALYEHAQEASQIGEPDFIGSIVAALRDGLPEGAPIHKVLDGIPRWTWADRHPHVPGNYWKHSWARTLERLCEALSDPAVLQHAESAVAWRMAHRGGCVVPPLHAILLLLGEHSRRGLWAPGGFRVDEHCAECGTCPPRCDRIDAGNEAFQLAVDQCFGPVFPLLPDEALAQGRRSLFQSRRFSWAWWLGFRSGSTVYSSTELVVCQQIAKVLKVALTSKEVRTLCRMGFSDFVRSLVAALDLPGLRLALLRDADGRHLPCTRTDLVAAAILALFERSATAGASPWLQSLRSFAQRHYDQRSGVLRDPMSYLRDDKSVRDLRRSEQASREFLEFREHVEEIWFRFLLSVPPSSWTSSGVHRPGSASKGQGTAGAPEPSAALPGERESVMPAEKAQEGAAKCHWEVAPGHEEVHHGHEQTIH